MLAATADRPPDGSARSPGHAATQASCPETATAADRANIGGIYTGLKTVITRDNGQSVNNTERWSALQARTLQLAVDQVGKYPGLDKAIEAVFLAEVGTDDVVPVTPDTVTKLVKACDVIINSACPAK